MSSRIFLGGKVRVHLGDSREVLAGFDSSSIDSVVCDPPYALAFMGKSWDNGATAFTVEFWAEVLRVVKPGGHVLAFSGTRTYHRLAVAIEDAGFEIRDMTAWIYGSGFPKSHDVSKGIDKTEGYWRGRAGAVTIETQVAKGTEYERTDKGDPITEDAIKWQGWGTALKPAFEPIVLARKPLIGTVAANVLTHGTGAINIDGCRVASDENLNGGAYARHTDTDGRSGSMAGPLRNSIGKEFVQPTGRWPANVIHDGSAEVVGAFPESVSQSGGNRGASQIWGSAHGEQERNGFDDSGSAARFFYTAKADSDDRIGSKHPTVKPVDLMRYLCRLITPPGGTVLDPFAGTGTTGEAAWLEGFQAVLIEREAEYMADIERRMALCLAGPVEKAHAIVKAKGLTEDPGPLFAAVNE